MSRLQLRALKAGEFAALNVSDEDLNALGGHWDELHEGGLRLIGPAFMLDADRVRATFEREKLDGVEERLEQFKSQGRLVEDELAPALVRSRNPARLQAGARRRTRPFAARVSCRNRRVETWLCTANGEGGIRTLGRG
jgi:hypothetical protein